MCEFSVEESLKIWEMNAQFWDEQMGDESNEFHRQVVRPKVTELLGLKAGEKILDIACGNGNYSGYLASHGVDVVAIDYSSKMIELAKNRQKRYLDHIQFSVVDATVYDELMKLEVKGSYDKAVSNMAIMDMAEVKPLFQAVNHLLKENGYFVFATQHPCFVTLTEQYLTAHSYKDIAIEGQPLKQCYYHRSLQDIFNLCFDNGFVIDGFYEEAFHGKEKPDVIIVRARKGKK